MTGSIATIKLAKVVSTSSDIETSAISNETLSSYAPQSLSTLTVNIVDADIFDPLSLASVIPSLRKDGDAQVVVRLEKDADASSIHTAIVLAGLTAESERMEDNGSTRVITSNFKPPKTSTAAKINIVKINIDEDDEFINEDDLLNDATNGLNAPQVMEARAKDDCDGRKPCDDCTCGRADMERAAAGNDAENEGSSAPVGRKVIKDLKSSCGNCSKGDAFRCAGCPFLGKPAFKEGEEHLVLDLTDDL